MAKLPKHLYAPILADMEHGQECYTVPWALVVDKDGTCYLNTSFDYSENPHGALSMKVERRHGRYYVRQPTEARYHRQDLSIKTNLAPVEAFI